MSQTVAQAGFDAWISEGGDYGNNHSVNIYSEGFLVSWLLDFELLARSELTKNYRDVHNHLSQQFRLTKGYNELDILAILQNLTGESYHAWWQKNVHGVISVDFKLLLAQAGLAMSYQKSAVSNNRSDENIDKDDELTMKAWTGINTQVSSGGLKVISVEKDSPGWHAGLTLGDTLIAVDGLRIIDKELSTRLENFKENQTIDVTLFRRDELMTKKLTLVAIAKNKLTIVPISGASKQQKAFFKQWTGLDFPTMN
jgi:predicted metalloprotease with PDZ domain